MAFNNFPGKACTGLAWKLRSLGGQRPNGQGRREDVREQCAGTGVRQSEVSVRVFCGRGNGCVGSVPGNLGSVSDRMREGWNTDHADSATESE